MAKYREIKGVTVQTRDEDPSLFIGTWSAGGNLNTDRWGNAGAGIQTSGLSINGQNPNSSCMPKCFIFLYSKSFPFFIHNNPYIKILRNFYSSIITILIVNNNFIDPTN